MPLDEALSAKIFDQYLKSLDAEKLFFVQADIDRLSALPHPARRRHPAAKT